MFESTQGGAQPTRTGTRSTREQNAADPQTPADAPGQPMGRLTTNFPIWVFAGVMAAGTLAAAIAGYPWFALAFAIVTLVAAGAALANAGDAAARQLDRQPVARQLGMPLGALSLVLAIVFIAGLVIIAG